MCYQRTKVQGILTCFRHLPVLVANFSVAHKRSRQSQKANAGADLRRPAFASSLNRSGGGDLPGSFPFPPPNTPPNTPFFPPGAPVPPRCLCLLLCVSGYDPYTPL